MKNLWKGCELVKIWKVERKELKEVLKKGKSFREDFLILRALKDEREKRLKFGILVSKKVFKKAVERNKLKRRIIEIIRANLKKIDPTVKLVFIPLPKINPNFGDLKEKVERILKKAKVLK